MLKWLVVSITQGSADAFVQTTITTGLLNTAKAAFRIRRIEMQFPSLTGGADMVHEFSITRKSLSAIPAITDHSVVTYQKRQLELTTSGMVAMDCVERQEFAKDEDLTIVEDPIYVQFDSAGTGAANTAYVRIGYEDRSISDVDRLSLIAASLS